MKRIVLPGVLFEEQIGNIRPLYLFMIPLENNGEKFTNFSPKTLERFTRFTKRESVPENVFMV